MQPEVVYRQIESFRKRFGEAHLFFAYHAAFPLALTPDLLYRLWANFQCDSEGIPINVPWIAVADLLLSSLCEEVGYELLEMKASVRNTLLQQLKNHERFGTKRIEELSDFLSAYVQSQIDNKDPNFADFAQAQNWTALGYKHPHKFVREIAQEFSRTSGKNKTEQIRIASLVETLAEPLVELKSQPIYEPLTTYACGMAKFARGDIEGATEQVSKLIGKDGKVEIASTKFYVPPEVSQRNTKSERNEKNEDPLTFPFRLAPKDRRKSGGSHFSTLRTKITDGEILKEALRSLGLTVKTYADVRGYNSQRVPADIVVVLEGEFDLGWSENSNGSFDLIADLRGIKREYNDTALINAINQKYRVVVSLSQAKQPEIWQSTWEKVPYVTTSPKKIKCPRCNSVQVNKYGYYHGKQNYKCRSCGTQFTEREFDGI